MSIPAAALPAPSYIVRWSRYEGGEPMTFGPFRSRADADDFADMLRNDPDKTATVEESTVLSAAQVPPPRPPDQAPPPASHTLLPCPFCGKPPRFIDDTGHGDCQVFCAEEYNGCPAPGAQSSAKEPHHAIAAWNRRAPVAQPEACEPPTAGSWPGRNARGGR